MRKLFTQQFMGVLAGVASIILSITLYAYRSDQKHIELQIIAEKESRITKDIELKNDLEQHKIEDDRQTEFLIKYLDQRFDDMEKLIEKN